MTKCLLINSYKTTLNNTIIENNILENDIRKLEEVIINKKYKLEKNNSTIEFHKTNISKLIGSTICDFDINILLLIIDKLLYKFGNNFYIKSFLQCKILNIYMVNKRFKELIENDFEYYIIHLFNKNVIHIEYIPKNVFRNNNITLDQLFYYKYIDYSLLSKICLKGHIKILKYILNKFPKINVNCLKQEMLKYINPLYIDIINLLIEHGLDNTKNEINYFVLELYHKYNLDKKIISKLIDNIYNNKLKYKELNEINVKPFLQSPYYYGGIVNNMIEYLDKNTNCDISIIGK
jgi:hypothetical protein